MSIPFPGFCGPSYQLDNRYAAVERLVNWYVVPTEGSEESKSNVTLAPSPGNAFFCPLPVQPPFNQPNRGLLEHRGVCYGVNGDVVFSLAENATFTKIGIVANDGMPCSMVANGTDQIFITSSGLGYVIPAGGAANSLVQIMGGGFLQSVYATFQDGYIIVVSPDSNQIQISGNDDTPIGDATLWDAANVSIQAGQADLLRAIISRREYLRLFGQRRSQIYYNAGANGPGGFPFQSYNETFIETGIAAPYSLADFGDSLVWIGEDARGMRACWKDSAFSPQRISNFAVERFWQQYVKVSDAVAFSFVWKGHLMYQITFPSAYATTAETPPGTPPSYQSATWVYDATTSQLIGRPAWSERQYQNGQGFLEGRSERFHCYCYGKHLVGSSGADGNPGAIYQYDDGPEGFTDWGVDASGELSQQAIVRDRICPHVWKNNKRLIFNRIEFELARGVGRDAGVFGSDPQILLRFSNDGGNTFGPEQQVAAGKIGEYNKRVYFNRCGSGRDRVFWVRCSDPVYWSLVGVQLDVFECAN